MYIRLILWGLLVLLSLITISHAQAQVNFTGATLTQNFNTLANTGTGNAFVNNTTIVGWYSNIAAYNGGNGSSSTSAMYSYGATASTDRALGGLTSNGVPSITYAIEIVNNTGATIDLSTLQVSYTGEQWRKQNNAAQVLLFDFLNAGASNVNQLAAGGYTATTALNFTSPITGGGGGTALDGNLPANQVQLASVISSTSQSWNNGDHLWLRWTQNADPQKDQGIAIDNVAIAAIPEPGTLSLFALGGLGMLSKHRRK
jgi:trimeric autotransporter adhesin